MGSEVSTIAVLATGRGNDATVERRAFGRRRGSQRHLQSTHFDTSGHSANDRRQRPRLCLEIAARRLITLPSPPGFFILIFSFSVSEHLVSVAATLIATCLLIAVLQKGFQFKELRIHTMQHFHFFKHTLTLDVSYVLY